MKGLLRKLLSLSAGQLLVTTHRPAFSLHTGHSRAPCREVVSACWGAGWTRSRNVEPYVENQKRHLPEAGTKSRGLNRPWILRFRAAPRGLLHSPSSSRLHPKAKALLMPRGAAVPSPCRPSPGRCTGTTSEPVTGCLESFVRLLSF